MGNTDHQNTGQNLNQNSVESTAGNAIIRFWRYVINESFDFSVFADFIIVQVQILLYAGDQFALFDQLVNFQPQTDSREAEKAAIDPEQIGITVFRKKQNAPYQKYT